MKYYIKRCHKDIGSDVVSGCKINLFSGIFCCFLQQEWKKCSLYIRLEDTDWLILNFIVIK